MVFFRVVSISFLFGLGRDGWARRRQPGECGEARDSLLVIGLGYASQASKVEMKVNRFGSREPVCDFGGQGNGLMCIAVAGFARDLPANGSKGGEAFVFEARSEHEVLRVRSLVKGRDSVALEVKHRVIKSPFAHCTTPLVDWVRHPDAPGNHTLLEWGEVNFGWWERF